MGSLILALLNAVGAALSAIFGFFKSKQAVSPTFAGQNMQNMMQQQMLNNQQMQQQMSQAQIERNLLNQGIQMNAAQGQMNMMRCPQCGGMFPYNNGIL